MTAEQPAAKPAHLPIVQRLFQDPPAYGFFQAVRLLRVAAYQRGQTTGDMAEAVRFRTNPSLDFPASAVQDLVSPDGDGAPAVMTVNFMGVHGVNGPLPRHYSELIHRLERERRDPERNALRAWFDLFNDRFIALFYEAWEKYRFWPAAERGAWDAPEPDAFTRCLLSLIGLGSRGLRKRFRILVDNGRQPETTLAEVRDEALSTRRSSATEDFSRSASAVRSVWSNSSPTTFHALYACSNSKDAGCRSPRNARPVWAKTTRTRRWESGQWLVTGFGMSRARSAFGSGLSITLSSSSSSRTGQSDLKASRLSF